MKTSDRCAGLATPLDPLELKIAVRQAVEHYRSGQALRENGSLGGLGEHLPEGVYLLDAERRVSPANPTAQEGLYALAGKGVAEVLTHLEEHPMDEVLAEVLLTAREGLSCEVKVPDSQRIFEVTACPLTSHSKLGEWVMVVREVTKQREAQGWMQQQERLASAGQLATGIAHDFHDLLTVMTSIAQMLERRPDTSAEGREMLRSIVSQGEQGAHLVGQLLDFSHQTAVQRQPVDLVPFLKEAIKSLGDILPKEIHLSLQWDREDYVVEANTAQLQQLVTNLVLNARNAMPEGGKLRLEISALQIGLNAPPPLPKMEPGRWVVLTAADTGKGMAAELAAHIFEPFFTAKQPGPSTGLGLAQVYGIVKQHRGEIAVSSRVGEGTTFSIYLPQAKGPAGLPLLLEAEMPRGKGEVVLVVEDQTLTREMAKAALEYLNYRVVAARNGRDALKIYNAHRDRVALVLTDMVMPEMGGRELIGILKENDPEIPVVVMSGYTLGDKEETQLPPGVEVAGYLPKPLVLEQLAQVVNEAISSRCIGTSLF